MLSLLVQMPAEAASPWIPPPGPLHFVEGEK